MRARGLRDCLFSGNQTEGPRARDQGGSLLLGIDGLIVDRVLLDDSGRRVVHCSTDPEVAGWWSVGTLKELTDEVCWSLPAECLSGPVVDLRGNFSEPFGAVNGKVGAFGEVLSEQPVHILVGATFPW